MMSPRTPKPEASAGPQPPSAGREDRRASLIRAAYDLILRDGFEGLRTRGIAERAGINVATLHYYFPTKEALISGLAEYLAGQFIGIHAPPVAPHASPAITRLRQEFADAKFYRTERPDLLTVFQELTLRARRDAVIARIIAPLGTGWRGGLTRMMAQGRQEGVFRADIDASTAVEFLMAVISGLITPAIEPAAIDRIGLEFEQWLTAASGGKPADQPSPHRDSQTRGQSTRHRG